jgi:predicted nucleotide-binding protein (sugar kinase/HSP70/actin superfamily)
LADESQEAFYTDIQNRGKEILAHLPEDKWTVVILSRPYNGCDRGLNLNLPKKLLDMEVLAIPMDFIPLHQGDIADEFPNMYWYYGQRILGAVEVIRDNPRLHAIYICNFRCGPDSFISHLVREKMGGKPYLQLEVDEHSADAGIITRCEAFFDSLKGVQREKKRGIG